jgi:hypothetical protein
MKKTYRDILDESIGIFKEELVRVDRRRIPFGRRRIDQFDPRNDDPILQAARRFHEFDSPNRRKGDVTRRAREQSRPSDESSPQE